VIEGKTRALSRAPAIHPFSVFMAFNIAMKKNRIHLWPAELLMLKLGAALLALDASLVLLRGVSLDTHRYGMTLGMAALIAAVGLAYRKSGRSEAIACTAIAFGLLVIFSSALSALNYLLLPNWRPGIDAWLAQVDALFGYHWPDAIALTARYPVVNELMRWSYNSTSLQIALVAVALGLTSRRRSLHAMMLTVAISSLATVAFWALVPSLGPTALHDLPAELLAAVQPVVDPAYGKEITTLMREGVTKLSPDEFRGLIAFPSFHTIMALIATYHAREMRWLLYPLLAVNALILPAVLIHGGHHLVDIPAGLAVFVLAALLARRMVGGTPSEKPATIAKKAAA
jgi:hypothetical protein